MPPPGKAQLKIVWGFTEYKNNVKKFLYNGFLNKKGFTLSEILITLGIVGVVAALTVPAMVTNYQKEQTAIQLKKTYSTLKQATEAAKVDYGDVKNWDYTLNEAEFMRKYYAPYIKYTQIGNSVKIKYKDLSGKDHTAIYATLHMADGVVFSVRFYRAMAQPFHILVDLNGDRGPNLLGRDVFAFSIFNNALNTYSQYQNTHSKTWVLGPWTSGQCNREAKGGVFGPGSYCSRVIELDGWAIKDGYPW